MNSRPLVSVIIPTYNRAGIICETIDNMFQQTYSNFELIIVDDGSTDNTEANLRQYGDRIQVVTQDTAGPAVARNHGVKVARGEIIAFQDSDDLWKPTKLERQVQLLEKDKSIPCCLCNIILRVVDGREHTSFDDSLIYPHYEEGIWLNVPEVLATRFVFFNQAVAIRREAWEKVGGFDETLKYLEDHDLPLRLSLEGPWAFIREPLVIYSNDSPLSFSQTVSKDSIVSKNCDLKILERILVMSNNKPGRASFQKLIIRRMRMIRREIRAIEFGKNALWGAQAIARFLLQAERYRRAVFRRSPSFPKAVIIPIPPPKLASSARLIRERGIS